MPKEKTHQNRKKSRREEEIVTVAVVNGLHQLYSKKGASNTSGLLFSGSCLCAQGKTVTFALGRSTCAGWDFECGQAFDRHAKER